MTKKNSLLFLFILLKFALQYFAIDSGYELHRDEYLHLDLGKHLAWGYTTVPPITALISYLIILLGGSVFWVKFFPALFGALTMVVVWKAVEELKGGLFALIVSAACVTFSVLLRINTLYQPNSLEYLLWTVLFFTLIKYINSENSKWLYLASLTFAIGFLNKYNIAFLMLGLFPSLLLTKNRNVFLNKHFYFSLALAVFIISPNLAWQFKNDFPVFHHLKALSEIQLVNVSRWNFVKEQILFFIGSFFIIIVAFLSFFRFHPFRKYLVFFFTYFFTLILFIYFKAKGYYAIGLYPIFFAFGAVYVEKLLASGWLQYLRPVVIIMPLVLFLPMFQIIVPVLSPEEIIQKSELFRRYDLTRWEDGKIYDLPQDFADMLGWRELANIVDSAFQMIDDKKSTIIHCDNYGQAGAINYYSKQKYTQAVSMHADYIYWYPLDEIEIINVILVQDRNDTDKNREKEKPLFENVLFVGEIENVNAREKGTKVYLLQGAKQSINKILAEEIMERKNNP